MRELSREELLKELDKAVGITIVAYQQIVRLIKKESLPNTSWEKSQITMEEAKTMIASLSNTIAELKKQKPKEVTEEWVKEMAVDIANDYGDVAFPNLITIVKRIIAEAEAEARK